MSIFPGDAPFQRDARLITALPPQNKDAALLYVFSGLFVGLVVGVTGVLEEEEDIDPYLTALRKALIQTLKDGKRISL